MTSQIIAIVPMRHFSQRVPGKNYRPLGPKPLYHYILESLLRSNVDKIIIDTDSEIIKTGISDIWGNNPKIMVLTRPLELTGPEVSMNRIIMSVLSRIWDEIDDQTIILQTHVTNPFLQFRTINQAIEEFESHQPETLLSVNSFQKRLWNREGFPINHNPGQLLQTQDLLELYEENSCLYLFRVKTMKKYNNRLGKKRHFFRMSHLESWDIDTEEDFNLAQAILKQSHQQAQTQAQAQALLTPDDVNSNSPHQAIQPLQSSSNINEPLFELLNQHLKPEIEQFLSENNARYRLLISAPYMMSDIDTFQQFYESLGFKVLVADVQERLSEEQLRTYRGQYDIAICGDDAFTTEILRDQGPRAICKWGTGIDSINQMTCRELKIPVYNTPNAFSIPVAQSTLSAILNFARQSSSSSHLMQDPKTPDAWVKLPATTLEEITIGIIGLGNVGQTLLNYLQPFQPTLLGYDIADIPHLPQSLTKVDELDDLLQQSDMICLCCNLDPSSFHIINTQTIKQIKKGAYLINMARGKLIEEPALVEALSTGHLTGAALDVFEQEPLPDTSPLRKMKNVLLSSHNANSSPKYWTKVHLNTVRNSFLAIQEIAKYS